MKTKTKHLFTLILSLLLLSALAGCGSSGPKVDWELNSAEQWAHP